MSNPSVPTATRRDVYADITSRLITAIEGNPGEAQLPWRRSAGSLSMPVNALTGHCYSGVNVLSLWVDAETRRFATPLWATYAQWQQLGAQVRGGENSSPVVFYKEVEISDHPDIAQDVRKRRVARAFWMFNAAQVDGCKASDNAESLGAIDRIEAADRFVAASGAIIEHGGASAFYRPATDRIQMASEDHFIGSATMTRHEGYYATLVHELTHWTGAKHRLNRDMGKRFADNAYIAEELVAEIASAFLSIELGITQDTRPDHAQYLAHWLRLMKSDSRAVFAAAGKASEAAFYLKKLAAESKRVA